ncbi:hypothetical protein CHS0354_000263 [Potamilus streckersoni]|uniref:Uncharacterized protein n=1 Tax=Potamilus streckersoni TaxID=2493646 RepID=A0AAE0RYF6_9BIVA|nr:hypothetical protein CHS0354_000263 [Potamilus streckersoni]
MESFRWSVRLNTIEVFLNDQIGVPSSFFPTVFGLRLAEDFQMGTSTPRSLHDHIGSAYVVIRWLEVEKEAERININGEKKKTKLNFSLKHDFIYIVPGMLNMTCK